MCYNRYEVGAKENGDWGAIRNHNYATCSHYNIVLELSKGFSEYLLAWWDV